MVHLPTFGWVFTGFHVGKHTSSSHRSSWDPTTPTTGVTSPSLSRYDDSRSNSSTSKPRFPGFLFLQSRRSIILG